MADENTDPAENKQADIDGVPLATAAEEAEIQKLLIEQGAIPDPGAAAPAAEPAAEEGVFDDPEEEAAAAAMAREAAGEETPPKEGAKSEEKPPEAEKKAEEPDDSEPSIARGLASLARKENQLREREKAISTKEKEFVQLQQQFDGLKKLALTDPAAFYEALGEKDHAKIAGYLYYAGNPEAAPPEFRVQRETFAIKRQMELMQRERENERAQIQRQQVEAQAVQYMTAVARKIPDDLPYLKAEASEDPVAAAQMLYQRFVNLRDAGMLGEARSDEEYAAITAKSLNDDIARTVQRIKKLHLAAGNTPGTTPTPPAGSVKTPAPAAEKIKTAPTRTISGKQASAQTRPRREPTHEEDIARVTAQLKSGTVPII